MQLNTVTTQLREHDTINQHYLDVGSSSTTLDQH